MRKFTLIVCLLLLPCAIMAEKQGKNIRFNIGLKTGFQAITYNDPYFEIDNYKYSYDEMKEAIEEALIEDEENEVLNKFFEDINKDYNVEILYKSK